MVFGDLHVSSRTPLSRIDNYGETVLNKLKSIRDLAIEEGVSTIITTGDFFEEYHEPISYMNRLIEVLNTFKDNNITFLSLIGNHDLPYNNMDYFHTTPLSLLFKSGLVQKLDMIENDNVQVWGLHFTEKEPLINLKVLEHRSLDSIKASLNEDKKLILVAHYAINNTVPNESIDEKNLKEFDIVFSGHDHMPYDPIYNDTTTILRPGSLTRMTKDTYNLERGIRVYIYDQEEDQISSKELPNVLDPKQIFKNKVFSDSSLNLYDNNLGSLFKEDSFNYDSYNMEEILASLPPTVNKESKEEVLRFLKQKGWSLNEN
jgi:DNA repair exonuclease SbcCD nuclease subunit